VCPQVPEDLHSTFHFLSFNLIEAIPTAKVFKDGSMSRLIVCLHPKLEPTVEKCGMWWNFIVEYIYLSPNIRNFFDLVNYSLQKDTIFKRKIPFACSVVYLHPKLKPIVEKCGENSIYNNNIFNLWSLIEKLYSRDGNWIEVNVLWQHVKSI